MTERELLKQALDALEPVSAYGRVGTKDVEQAALQQACAAISTHARIALEQDARIKVLEEALRVIVNAYDAYRGRGVSPAPAEYGNLVDAIHRARAALEVPNG